MSDFGFNNPSTKTFLPAGLQRSIKRRVLRCTHDVSCIAPTRKNLFHRSPNLSGAADAEPPVHTFRTPGIWSEDNFLHRGSLGHKLPGNRRRLPLRSTNYAQRLETRQR